MLDSQVINAFKNIFSKNGNNRYGFSNKKLPKIVNKPVKISDINNNENIKNNLNLNEAKKKNLTNLKFISNNINSCSQEIKNGGNNNFKITTLNT